MTTATLTHLSDASLASSMDHLIAARRNLLKGIQSTPAVQSLVSGQPNPADYKRYLINVWHYARHSATVIALAGSRCVSTHPELANYLFHHAREELGHEQWALEDLATLGVAPADVFDTQPLPSCAAMVGYEYYIAGHANPVGIFGWLYILEAMGEDLGPTISAQLSKVFSNGTGTRFVRAHGEADELHTRDLTEQITTHIGRADMTHVNHVADVVSQLYLGIFQQLPHGSGNHDHADTQGRGS
ncbi:MAG TPA: iron-containing redox enzyme family protein [Burkholderiales bacterium]|nr:iron-containing redox enzyme family protein [Burkholderiales bacterium]